MQGLKSAKTGIEKNILFFVCRLLSIERLVAKTREGRFLKVQFGKITVCSWKLLEEKLHYLSPYVKQCCQ